MLHKFEKPQKCGFFRWFARNDARKASTIFARKKRIKNKNCVILQPKCCTIVAHFAKKNEKMATLSHEVSDYRRADGTYLVKIRMIHNRKTIRKATGIYATADQLSRDHARIRDPRLLEAVNAVVERLRMAAAQVDGAEFMDAATLWARMTRRMEAERGFRLDVYEFAATMTARMTKGTADGYRYALNSLRSFTGKDRLDINEVTYDLLVAWRDWIERRNGKGCRAASFYLERLKAIHSEARAVYNDEDTGVVRIPRQPFRKGLIPPQPATRHRDITASDIRAIAACEPSTQRGRWARDVFVLSFCLCGINTADLYGLRNGDIVDGVLTYQRRKTRGRRADHAEARVKVEPEAAAIIARYAATGGDLLPFKARYCSFKEFNRAMNVGLKEVGRLVGVDGLTTYHARHTWATLARNAAGVDRSTVGEALVHASRGSERVTDIYLARDFSRVWEANRKVLDLVFSR